MAMPTPRQRRRRQTSGADEPRHQSLAGLGPPQRVRRAPPTGEPDVPTTETQPTPLTLSLRRHSKRLRARAPALAGPAAATPIQAGAAALSSPSTEGDRTAATYACTMTRCHGRPFETLSQLTAHLEAEHGAGAWHKMPCQAGRDDSAEHLPLSPDCRGSHSAHSQQQSRHHRRHCPIATCQRAPFKRANQLQNLLQHLNSRSHTAAERRAVAEHPACPEDISNTPFCQGCHQFLLGEHLQDHYSTTECGLTVAKQVSACEAYGQGPEEEDEHLQQLRQQNREELDGIAIIFASTDESSTSSGSEQPESPSKTTAIASHSPGSGHRGQNTGRHCHDPQPPFV